MKISVIVPVYNVEKYLHQCIDSILNQSLQDFELILVDDGSTDSSGKICDEYKLKDNRVKVIHQKNQYVGIARNNGFAIATGDYTIFLDSDDYFDPDMFQRMYDKAIETEAEIVICNEYCYYQKTGVKKKFPISKEKLDIITTQEVYSGISKAKFFFQSDPFWPWDKLFKTSYLKEIDLYYPTNRIVEACEDLVYCSLAMAQAKRIYSMPEYFIVHRYHSESLEATRDPIASISALKLLQKDLKTKGLYQYFEQSFINLALEYNTNYMNGHKKDLKKKTRLYKEHKKAIAAYFKYMKIQSYPKEFFFNKSLQAEALKYTDNFKYIKYCIDKYLRYFIATK